MLRRHIRVLMAFVIAVVAIMPAGAHVSPMKAGLVQAGASQPCQPCPDHPMPGQASGKMALCPMLTCAGPLLAVTAANPLGSRRIGRIAYGAIPLVHLRGTTPAPDPLPPRPIVFA